MRDTKPGDLVRRRDELARMLTEVRLAYARARSRLDMARKTGAPPELIKELEDAGAYTAEAVELGELEWMRLRLAMQAHGHDIGEIPPVDALLVRGEVAVDAECE